jgi:hypothetical protein
VLVALVAAAVVSVTLAGVQLAPNARAAAVERSAVSILGPSRMGAPNLVLAYEAIGHDPNLTVTVPELAQIYIEEGERYGVRADIAWAQALVETAWFTYPSYGQVRDSDNNFAGIGAYDGGSHGFGYPDARTGVRAQMQLLRQYADEDALDELPDPPLVHAPASKRGAVETWLEMGNGNWATSTRYSDTVLRVYFQLVQLGGVAAYAEAARPVARPGDGMWLAGATGHVYDVGDARFWGSAGGRVSSASITGIGLSRSAEGYWMVTSDGYVGAFGDAVRWGDAHDRTLAPIVDIAGDPSGSGYWVLSAAGEVHAFGSAARMELAPGALPSGAAFVALASTPTGHGYWLADAAGHVVGVGDAAFAGDAAGEIDAGDPIVDIAPRPWGDGYWLVTASGEVHAFGKAKDLGTLRDSDGDDAPVRSVIGIASTVSGAGYWLVASDGHVAGLGDAVAFADTSLRDGPVTAVAGRMEIAATPAR